MSFDKIAEKIGENSIEITVGGITLKISENIEPVKLRNIITGLRDM